jgi:hypothetical protein
VPETGDVNPCAVQRRCKYSRKYSETGLECIVWHGGDAAMQHHGPRSRGATPARAGLARRPLLFTFQITAAGREALLRNSSS